MMLLGILFVNRDKMAEAESFLRQAMALCESRSCSPGDWGTAACGLGLLYVNHGRKQEAESLAARLEKYYENFSIDYESIGDFMSLADIHMKLGNIPKAEALLRRIIAARGLLSADENMAGAETALAEIDRAQGRLAEAERFYREAARSTRVAAMESHRSRR